MSNFFAQLSMFNATPYAKAKIAKAKDPLEQAKLKFAKQADETIKLIKNAADKGLWFKREGDSIIVSLKNGVAVLSKDTPAYVLPDAATAIKFIEAAKTAAEAGEFDEMFKSTNRGPRKPIQSADAKLNPPAEQQQEPAASTPAPALAPKAPNKRK